MQPVSRSVGGDRTSRVSTVVNLNGRVNSFLFSLAILRI